jgi:hypothetical protein
VTAVQATGLARTFGDYQAADGVSRLSLRSDLPRGHLPGDRFTPAQGGRSARCRNDYLHNAVSSIRLQASILIRAALRTVTPDTAVGKPCPFTQRDGQSPPQPSTSRRKSTAAAASSSRKVSDSSLPRASRYWTATETRPSLRVLRLIQAM